MASFATSAVVNRRRRASEKLRRYRYLQSQERIWADFLQCGRAVGALGVVLSHAGQKALNFGFDIPIDLERILSRGSLGVDFFFVLSGFIIHQIHSADTKTPVAALTYARKRLIRIYIPYLPVSLAMIMLYFIFPHVSAATGANAEWSYTTSLLLVPSGSRPALPVAWTLVHEVTFYAVFSAFYFTRYFYALLWAWSGVLLLVLLGLLDPIGGAGRSLEATSAHAAMLKVLFSPLNLEFLMGIAASSILIETSWSPLPLLLAATLSAFFYFLSPGGDHILFGLAMALLTVGMVQAEEIYGWHFPIWLVLLGDASYSIYLIHNPVISYLL